MCQCCQLHAAAAAGDQGESATLLFGHCLDIDVIICQRAAITAHALLNTRRTGWYAPPSWRAARTSSAVCSTSRRRWQVMAAGPPIATAAAASSQPRCQIKVGLVIQTFVCSKLLANTIIKRGHVCVCLSSVICLGYILRAPACSIITYSVCVLSAVETGVDSSSDVAAAAAAASASL